CNGINSRDAPIPANRKGGIMTNLPGEGQAPQPIINREAMIIDLEGQLSGMAQLVGQLAVGMEDISKQLAALRGEQTLDTTPEAQEARSEVVEPYSRAEDEAATSQDEYERLIELDKQLDGEIQDIFAPTMRGFMGVMLVKANPSKDLMLNGKRPNSRLLDKLSAYDPEDKKEWDKTVEKYGQKLEWTEDDLGGEFSCTYNVDYVPLKDGGLELIGYGFTRKPGPSTEPLIAVEKELRGRVAVSVKCPGGKARKVEIDYLGKDDGDVSRMRYDFDNQTIEKKSGNTGAVTASYSYVPERYRYEGRNMSGPAHIPAGDMLHALDDFIRLMPSKKQ
ncbi:MAG TPA: hypothetical protein VLA92_05180, partial [Candidatus Saccharimonadales bacterium]|nr:hypothetical protein [Candidatus Saccharimonadales bacterium]